MTAYFKKRLPVFAAAFALWAILVFTQKAFLIRNGEFSLFLYDWDFLKEPFTVPGGFLGLVGSFFSQFLLIPWLGSLIWVILLSVAGIMTVRVFGIPTKMAALGGLPVAILVLSNMSLGYGIYVLGAFDHFFAPTIGYLFMLGIIGLTCRSGKFLSRIAILAVSAAAGFILAGVYALAGVVFAGLTVATAQNGPSVPGVRNTMERISYPVISLALCLAVTYPCYFLFASFTLSNWWALGLSYVNFSDSGIVMSGLLFGIAAIFSSARFLFESSGRNNRNMAAFNPAIALVAITVTAFFWYKDANFKTELEMTLAAEQYDWRKVEDIYRKASDRWTRQEKAYDELEHELSNAVDNEESTEILEKYGKRIFTPTRYMVVLRDLSLLKQGKALDSAFTLRDGKNTQFLKNTRIHSLENGPLVFFNYGLPNIEYHWCIERQVITGWNYSLLKYMAMHAVLVNEPEFASKFLDKLDKTLFYRKWSRRQRSLSTDVQAMSSALPYREIIPYMCIDDRMAEYDDGDYETFLINHFYRNRSERSTPEFDRAALLWAMRYKDSRMFWKAFSQYLLSDTVEQRIPKHVQEAALLFCVIEKEDLGIPFDKDVINRFSKFQESFGKYRTGGISRYRMLKGFGDTYFYYYYFENVYSFRF